LLEYVYFPSSREAANAADHASLHTSLHALACLYITQTAP